MFLLSWRFLIPGHHSCCWASSTRCCAACVAPSICTYLSGEDLRWRIPRLKEWWVSMEFNVPHIIAILHNFTISSICIFGYWLKILPWKSVLFYDQEDKAVPLVRSAFRLDPNIWPNKNISVWLQISAQTCHSYLSDHIISQTVPKTTSSSNRETIIYIYIYM